MSFDPISWALGWGLGKLGAGVIKSLTPTDLGRRLNATVEDWAAALPKDRSASPSAIFVMACPETGPAQSLLRERLLDGVPPSDDKWLEALLERWRTVQQLDGEFQPFFEIPEAEEREELVRLARRIADVCLGDERMYRHATSRLRSRLAALQDSRAILAVNEIVEPPSWSTHYSVGFHLFDGTELALLISGLAANVLEVRPMYLSRTITPGAAVEEHAFDVLLPPILGSVPLQPREARRFRLQPQETEFFRLEISAAPGHEYCVALTAGVANLVTQAVTDVATPDLWYAFARTL